MKKLFVVIPFTIFSAQVIAQGVKGPATQELALGKNESVVGVTPEKIVTAAAAADSDADVGKNMTFNDWVEEFEKKFDMRVGVMDEGRMFFSGQAAIRVDPSDPNYGKELALAYERAVRDMQADFVLKTYGAIQTRTLVDLVEDLSTNGNDFSEPVVKVAVEKGKFGSLLDKALNLIGKKIDAELIKQGVDASELNRTSVEQKKTLYKNNLSKSVLKQAVRSMQGLVPVQTRIFSQRTANGKGFSVGVIAVQSRKTRQFAMDMSAKRLTGVRGDPTPPESLLPKTNAGFLDEIGLRYTYDEKGRPTLVAYGRWAVSVRPDWKPNRVISSTNMAKEKAESLAEAMILEFENTNVQVESTFDAGSQDEETLRQVTAFNDGKKVSSEKIHEVVGATIDRFFKSIKTTASGTLRGQTRLKRWEETDQNGVLHVGTVVAWRYDALENANAVERETSAAGKSSGGDRR